MNIQNNVYQLVVEVCIGFIRSFLTLFSFPLEILLRREFGERFLGIRMLKTVLILGFWFFAGVFNKVFLREVLEIRGNDKYLFFAGFIAFTFIVALFHGWQIMKRNKAGKRWHSQFSGFSRLNLKSLLLPNLIGVFVAVTAVYFLLAFIAHEASSKQSCRFRNTFTVIFYCSDSSPAQGVYYSS